MVFDNDLASESDGVETRPPERTNINLETAKNSYWRPCGRRHSTTKKQGTRGPGHNSGTQNDHHKRLLNELAWQQTRYLEHQPRFLEDTFTTSEPQPPSDCASTISEGKLSRKFWKQEFIPPENILVYDAAKVYLQAEVYTGQHWPSTAVIENIVERAWALALDQRKLEKQEYYRLGDQQRTEQSPFPLPDAIPLEILSSLTQP